MTVFCKDCRHSGTGRSASFDDRRLFCIRVIGTEIDIATGEHPIMLNKKCSSERKRDERGLFRKRQCCGPSGRFFEAGCSIGTPPTTGSVVGKPARPSR